MHREKIVLKRIFWVEGGLELTLPSAHRQIWDVQRAKRMCLFTFKPVVLNHCVKSCMRPKHPLCGLQQSFEKT